MRNRFHAWFEYGAKVFPWSLIHCRKGCTCAGGSRGSGEPQHASSYYPLKNLSLSIWCIAMPPFHSHTATLKQIVPDRRMIQ